VLPLSAAPVGRGADGVDAMALFGNLMMMMMMMMTMERCSLFLPLRWGAGSMALMLWLDLVI
jgi:hypothetical protein